MVVFAFVGFESVLHLLQWAVALPCIWLAVGLVATWPKNGRHPKYWIVFGCLMQTWGVGVVMYFLRESSPYAGPLWIVSMQLLLVGVVLYFLWPDPE